MSSNSTDVYFVPEPSQWPIVGSLALFTSFVGGAMMLNGSTWGTFILGMGIAAVIYMFAGWFADVIGESIEGNYNKQVDISFRWGMAWFIFSEVMFFAAFFGALFYVRQLSGPWLGGEGTGFLTNFYLWSGFEFEWPMLTTPDAAGGAESAYTQISSVIGAWGVPAINTGLLLASGVTLTIAHHALKAGHRASLNWWLMATIVLGAIFLYFQAHEYAIAYSDAHNLKLDSGAYGSTFFMLTGFHGFHVTMGATMLFVIWWRCMKGHFSPEDHFGFEAVAWYWHFVDVVWLGLFIFVYWI